MRAFLAVCVLFLCVQTSLAAPIFLPLTIDSDQSFVTLSMTADGIYKQSLVNGIPTALMGTLNATLNLSSIYPIGIEINPSEISSENITVGAVLLYDSPTDTKFSHVVFAILGFVSTGYSLAPTNIYFDGVFDNSQMMIQDSTVWHEGEIHGDDTFFHYPFSQFAGTPVDVPFEASITVEPFGPNNLYTITLPLHQGISFGMFERQIIVEMTGQIVATAVIPPPVNYGGEPDPRPLVPEPSANLLLGIGILVSGLFLWRHRARSQRCAIPTRPENWSRCG
ncbi:MAG: PEP-CTERM sorting domain-containing protein [Pirellulales bacterium]